MLKQKPHLLCFFIFLGIAAAANSQVAADANKTEKTLSQIAAEIQKINEQDIKLEGEAGTLIKKLRDSSKKLNSVSQKTRQLEDKIQQQEQALAALQQRREDALQSRTRSQKALQENLISQQKIRRGLKASPLDSGQVGMSLRLEYWLDHLARQHQSLIQSLEASASELAATEAEHEAQLQSIRQQRGELGKQQRTLEQEREKQKKLAKDIERKRKSNDSRKQTLLMDQERLKKLLERLRFAEQFPEFSQAGKTAFGKLKGKLPWPVKGQPVKNQFSSGVTLTVAPGTQVRAISHGRVLFADWMKGFGMLVIIDHGEGYLSLYGHNESLYTKAGDWVEPGTVVSSSGQSSVGEHAGVYFEIRRKAQALHPEEWCKRP